MSGVDLCYFYMVGVSNHVMDTWRLVKRILSPQLYILHLDLSKPQAAPILRRPEADRSLYLYLKDSVKQNAYIITQRIYS